MATNTAVAYEVAAGFSTNVHQASLFAAPLVEWLDDQVSAEVAQSALRSAGAMHQNNLPAGGYTPVERIIATAARFYAAVLPSPTVASINPTNGDDEGGTAVTITGTGFANGASVKIGGVSATDVVVVSATSITAVSPAHAVGAADVVVTNSDAGADPAVLVGGFTYANTTVTVPNIVGMTDTEADAALVAVGLTVGTVTTSAGTLDEVLTQNPAAAARVAIGSAVAYSKGDGN